MQDMSQNLVGEAWDDAKYQGAILKKGERRQSAPRPKRNRGIVEMTHTKICTNCGLPFAIKFENRCRCSMWEVGRK